MEKIKYGVGKNPNSHPKGRRKYNVNDDFFEKPNLINSYYAGFIAADGCIFNNKHYSNYLIFGLSIKDKDFLEEFKKNIQFDGPIIEYLSKGRKYVRLTINSTKICNDLKENFNITPKKTFTLVPPNITKKEYIDAFICGYIDGDGYISFCNLHAQHKQKTCVIGMIGTYEILMWILNRFKGIHTPNNKNSKNKKPQIVKGGFGNHRTDGKHVYSMSFSNKWARNIILKMFEYDIPLMKRKWSDEVFEFCKNYQKRKPISKRKGVNVFDLDGNLICKCQTLQEADNITHVTVGRISALCKQDDSKHMSKGYMFSRNKEIMQPYTPDNYFAINNLKTNYQCNEKGC